MQIFLVGGAVRDALMGRKPKDQDYVVVGGTPALMLELGYRQVGADFPVFLHPVTGEEYALARTARTEFATEPVSLEDDLGRRDLTINAMAVDDADHIVDPFGGQADLENQVLRHVREASFVEDPIRVLRLARFAARYPHFTVAPETLALCRSMVAAGDLDSLVPERVWQEFAKGLMEHKPSSMFDVLRECGALAVVMPELDRLAGIPQPVASHPEVDTYVHTMMTVDLAAVRGELLEVRFAVLTHDLGKGVTPADSWPKHHDHEELGVPLIEALAERLRVPSSCREVAVAVAREHTHVHRAQELKATSVVRLLKRVDAFRRPTRLESLLNACECDARGRLGFENRPYPQATLMRRAFEAAQTVNAGEVAKTCAKTAYIADRIHAARSRKVKAALAVD